MTKQLVCEGECNPNLEWERPYKHTVHDFQQRVIRTMTGGDGTEKVAYDVYVCRVCATERRLGWDNP